MAVSRAMGWVVVALAVSGCGTDTVPASVTTGTAVLTYHDPATLFGQLPTYAIVSQLAVVTYVNAVPTYTFVPAPEILGAVERNMAARGFELVARVDPSHPPPTPTQADLSIVVLGYQGTDYLYYPCDFWPWWGYPDAGCSTGWNWVAYRTGTLVMEMGNTSVPPPPGGTIPIVWAGAGYTVLTPGLATNVQNAVDAVDQAFLQSPYLKTP
jgi:hypothetical protein